MFPDKQNAISLLHTAQTLNPGPWVQHSYTTAECAEKIAKACNLNTDKAYVLGLLHDIGRHFKIPGFGHIYHGYKYMLSLEYDEVARVCLSHSFTSQNISSYIGAIDVSDEEFSEAKTILEKMEFDDYDRLIQLCDSLAGTSVMSMIDRMDDVQKRYGSYCPQMRAKNIELKAYFESIANENIYKLVTDDKELWGK